MVITLLNYLSIVHGRLELTVDIPLPALALNR